MAITDDLILQGDIDTRGRSDGTYYDHILAQVGTDTGTPDGFTGDGGYAGLDYANTGEYTTIDVSSIASTLNGGTDLTIAVRTEWDADMTDNAYFISINLLSHTTITENGFFLYAFNADDVESRVVDNSGGMRRGWSTTTPGSDGEHVFVMTWDATDGDANARRHYMDGTEVSSGTAGSGVSGTWTVDQLTLGHQVYNSGTSSGPNDVRSLWYAVWDRILTSGEIEALDDTENPFDVSGGAIPVIAHHQRMMRG